MVSAKDLFKQIKGELPVEKKAFANHHTPNPNDKLRTRKLAMAKPIKQIDLQTREVLAEFSSISQAARSLNICLTSISRTAQGYQRQAGGFLFQFV